MGIGNELAPATSMFSGSLGRMATYAWVLIPMVIIAILILSVVFIKKIRNKKEQWSHTLIVKRVLQDGSLSQPKIHKMRRFPIIKNAEVFELEKPLLGGYLMPELAEYTGSNEYSIILDKNNRIYTVGKQYFSPDKSCINVSAKHSEIDIERSNLRTKYQDINKVSKRIEWSAIAKYAFMATAVIAVTIILIVGIQKWGEAQEFKVAEAQLEAQSWENMNDVMDTMSAVVNTQQLELKKLLEELYGTKNIQSVLNQS